MNPLFGKRPPVPKTHTLWQIPRMTAGAPIPPAPPPMTTTTTSNTTASVSATTTTTAAADKCRRLHQLIGDFTKRELQEVLAEFHWTYCVTNRTGLLLRCKQLIDSPDINVKHLTHVIRTIDKRKANRKPKNQTAKRSVANDGVNGDRQRRPTPPPPKKKRQRVKSPLIANHTQISPPTVPIDSVNPSPPVTINVLNTHLSPPLDTSGQEMVTGYAFRPLPKCTIVKRLRETEVLPSISDRGVFKAFFVDEHDFPDKYFILDRSLATILAKNGMKIQLRFSHTAEPAAKDSVPEALYIDVNRVRIYTYADDQQWCRPFDVSQYCRLGLNDIHFSLSSKNSEYLLPTLFEISIVTELTDQSFITLLTSDSKHRLTTDATKALISRRIGHNTSDDGISLLDDSIQVSLICPLSHSRLRIPCRTVTCQHIECFDGQSFFALNEWRYDWCCPICQASADLSAIRVDTYFESVLTKTPQLVTSIRVKRDGEYVIGGRFEGQVIQLVDDSVVDVIDSTGNSDDNDSDCNILYEKVITIT